MKQLTLVMATLLCLTFTACGSKPVEPSTDPAAASSDASSTSATPAPAADTGESRVLNVFIWSDYVDPDLVKEFEKKFNCKVQFSYFETNEQMLAKVKAGAANFDILYPSSYMVKTLLLDDAIQTLDQSLLPNLMHIDPNYRKLIAEPNMEHSVPYMVSTTGIGYLAENGELEPSWKVLADPAYKGRVTMLDDMREVIGAALKFHGNSLNSVDEKQLAEARDTAIVWKRNAAKFESTQYHYGLASGEFKMVLGYGGDILQVQSENPNIKFMLPAEGFAFTCDQMVIPKAAKETKLAHEWINFFHEPGVAARNTTFTKYLVPNIASYDKLAPELKANPAIFPPPEVLSRAEYQFDLGADLPKWTKIWDEIKAAQ